MDVLVNVTHKFSSCHLTDAVYRTRLCACLVTRQSRCRLISRFSVEVIFVLFHWSGRIVSIFEEAAFLWPRTATPDLGH